MDSNASFRPVLLCWSWVRTVGQELHGAHRRATPLQHGELCVCAAGDEEDAGTPHGPQRHPAGHLPQVVWNGQEVSSHGIVIFFVTILLSYV